MFTYIVRRLFQSLLVLLIVMFVTFSLPYFQDHGIYGPAYAVLTTHATPANVARFGQTYGFNHPFFVRFWNYLTQLLFHLNLGHSYKQNQSVLFD